MPDDIGTKPWTSLVWKLTALAVVLIVYGAAVTIALLQSNHAISCINDSLGERGAQGQAYDEAVGDVFSVIYLQGKGALSKEQAQKRFLHDAATVRGVTHYRHTHPLGMC